MSKKKLTRQQQKALHLWFEMIAEKLNDAGYDIPTVMENYTMDVSWTKQSVKENIWRVAQKSKYSKESTTQLSKQGEIDRLVKDINRFLGELGIENTEFPYTCRECGHVGNHNKNCSFYGIG